MEVVEFHKSYNRQNFRCEEDELTTYLQKRASSDIRHHMAVCYLLVDENQEVIGYYTLTSESIERDEVPEKYRKSVPPTYKAPVILLGRIARHIDYKDVRIGKHRVGAYLLKDALLRCLKLSKQQIGAMAIVLDPMNDKLRKIYRGYGFLDLPDSGRMFLPMKDLLASKDARLG